MGKAGKLGAGAAEALGRALGGGRASLGVGQSEPERAEKGPGGGGTGLGEEVGDGDSLTSVLNRQMVQLWQGFLEDF